MSLLFKTAFTRHSPPPPCVYQRTQTKARKTTSGSQLYLSTNLIDYTKLSLSVFGENNLPLPTLTLCINIKYII